MKAYARRFLPNQFFMDNMLAGRNKLIIYLLLSIILFFIYLFVAFMRPQNTFWSIDSGGKFIYLENVIRTGDPSAPLIYPSRELDPEAKFPPIYFRIQQGDQYYTWWFVGFPLLSIPFYLFFGWIGLFILPAIGGVLTSLLSALTIDELFPKPSIRGIITFLVISLATPIAFYSTMFWEHTLATAFCIASLYSIIKSFKTNKFIWLILAGAFTSIAIFLRIELGVLLLGVGFAVLLFSWRCGLKYALIVLLISIPWLLFNKYVTGYFLTPITNAILSGSDAFTGLSSMGRRILAYFLINPPHLWSLVPNRTELYIITIAFPMLVITALFKKLWGVSLLLIGVFLVICARITYANYGYRSVHGFVLAAPCILFALFYLGSIKRWRKSIFYWMVLSASIFFGLVYIYKAWLGAGGLQWGPRYLLAFYPILVICAVMGWTDVIQSNKWWIKISLIVLGSFSVILGITIQVRGEITVHQTLRFQQQTEIAINEIDDPIVIQWCDIALNSPNLYWEKTKLFSITGKTIEEWLNYAEQTGIKEFELINIDLCDPDATMGKLINNRKVNPGGLIRKHYIVSSTR